MILCMVVLGGMGHIAGVVLGAMLLAILPEALRAAGDWEQMVFGRIWVDPSNLRLLLFGMALVLMMLRRPGGLWPSNARRNELQGQ